MRTLDEKISIAACLLSNRNERKTFLAGASFVKKILSEEIAELRDQYLNEIAILKNRLDSKVGKNAEFR